MDARVAHHAAEPDRRAAGRGRSRPGGPLRGLRRQRRDRCRDPDLYRGDRVRDVGVQRHGGAGGPLCRGQRAREGQSHRVPGVPGRPGAVGPRPHSARAARNAWYAVRLTFSGSLAPAKRATSTAMPLNTDITNAITTIKIWIATPIAALPA